MRPFCGMGRLEFRYRVPGSRPHPSKALAVDERVDIPGVEDTPAPLDSSTGDGGPVSTGDKDDSPIGAPSDCKSVTTVDVEPCPRDLNPDSGS